MSLKNKYGQWACVLGAAEGLGAAFSRVLASEGFNLMLVDIDNSKLKKTGEFIRSNYNVETVILIQDLSETQRVTSIIEQIKALDCRFMIYNAAYGPVKPFLSNTPEELDLYQNINMNTTLHLVYQFIEMHLNRPSGILLLSSLAGFRGTQFVVPYAATKAFLWNLAEGLYYEFKDQHLDISVCVAGATDTPNFRSTNPKKGLFSPKPMNPELVAKEAIRYFGKKLFIVPGFSNKMAHLILSRVLPRQWASAIHNATMKKMYS
jgi:short-subunit dehydrogenase